MLALIQGLCCIAFVLTRMQVQGHQGAGKKKMELSAKHSAFLSSVPKRNMEHINQNSRIFRERVYVFDAPAQMRMCASHVRTLHFPCCGCARRPAFVTFFWSSPTFLSFKHKTGRKRNASRPIPLFNEN